MSSYKARYQGSNEEVLSEGASPRMAAKTFMEKVGYKPIPVEVWNDRWIIFDSHIDEHLRRAYQMEAEEKERASYQMQAEDKKKSGWAYRGNNWGWAFLFLIILALIINFEFGLPREAFYVSLGSGFSMFMWCGFYDFFFGGNGQG